MLAAPLRRFRMDYFLRRQVIPCRAASSDASAGQVLLGCLNEGNEICIGYAAFAPAMIRAPGAAVPEVRRTPGEALDMRLPLQCGVRIWLNRWPRRVRDFQAQGWAYQPA